MRRLRRSYSGVEIEKYLAKFLEFNGSKARFCREKDLSISTFTNWQKLHTKEIADSFVEIEIPQPANELSTIKYGKFSLSNFENISTNKLTQILTSFVEASRVSTSSN